MSIHWQTGEPPEGKILAEYRMRGLAKVYQDVIHNARHCEVEILRWSTLDAAPDVLGRLDRYMSDESREYPNMLLTRVKTSDGAMYEVAEYDCHDDDHSMGRSAYAPSLAAAIEQLCGGTDAET